MDTISGITPIGITNYRSTSQPFGIRDKDRLGHIYVIGKTGMGKSTLLENMAISDIERGHGLCVIDPHGDIAEDLLNYIPKHRIADVIYFNATDTEHPIAFNPLKGIHPNFHHLVASGLVGTFKKIWSDSWGPRLEHIFRFALLTLLSVPDATLLDIQLLLTSKEYRDHALSYVRENHILNFWKGEFEKYSPTQRADAVSSILNKTGLFQTSIPLRNIMSQKVRSFRMQGVMDNGKILIVNLAKGTIGEDACALLGSMLISSIQLAALHRAGKNEADRKPFYLYVDEVHSFISLSFSDILAEARKYGLGLFITHQYLDQLDERIRSAVFGNVGTIISFRVGAGDAELLVKEFYPVFIQDDFINLPHHAMYLKLLVDGTTTVPFSAYSLSKKIVQASFKKEVIAASKIKYGRAKSLVETSPAEKIILNRPTPKQVSLLPD